MKEPMVHILEFVSLGIGVAGVAVVAWGASKALVELVLIELRGFRGDFICSKRQYLRHRRYPHCYKLLPQQGAS